jgi:hypothetical protein
MQPVLEMMLGQLVLVVVLVQLDQPFCSTIMSTFFMHASITPNLTQKMKLD